MRDYVTQEERLKKHAMFMQMGGHPAAFFNGEAASYMFPPYQYPYGLDPSAQPMSGLNGFTSYFADRHSPTCSIM